MYKVVGVVPFVLWKYIENKVVGFENGLEMMKYQLLPSKRVQVDVKRGEIVGGNGPSSRHWKKIKKRRYMK